MSLPAILALLSLTITGIQPAAAAQGHDVVNAHTESVPSVTLEIGREQLVGLAATRAIAFGPVIDDARTVTGYRFLGDGPLIEGFIGPDDVLLLDNQPGDALLRQLFSASSVTIHVATADGTSQARRLQIHGPALEPPAKVAVVLTWPQSASLTAGQPSTRQVPRSWLAGVLDQPSGSMGYRSRVSDLDGQFTPLLGLLSGDVLVEPADVDALAELLRTAERVDITVDRGGVLHEVRVDLEGAPLPAPEAVAVPLSQGLAWKMGAAFTEGRAHIPRAGLAHLVQGGASVTLRPSRDAHGAMLGYDVRSQFLSELGMEGLLIAADDVPIDTDARARETVRRLFDAQEVTWTLARDGETIRRTLVIDGPAVDVPPGVWSVLVIDTSEKARRLGVVRRGDTITVPRASLQIPLGGAAATRLSSLVGLDAAAALVGAPYTATISQVDGHPISEPRDLEAARRVLATGDRVTLELESHNGPVTLSLELSGPPIQLDQARHAWTEAERQAFTPNCRWLPHSQTGPQRGFDGVRFTGLRRENVLVQKGLRDADVVHTVNGRSTVEDGVVEGLWEAVRNGDPVELTITRHGGPVVLSWEGAR